jgi:hypothetical protein
MPNLTEIPIPKIPLPSNVQEWLLVFAIISVLIGPAVIFRLYSYLKPDKERVALRRHRRLEIIEYVRNIWIKGILLNSLYRITKIELCLDERRDEIDLFSNLMVRQPNYAPRNLPSSAKIIEIFDELGKSFLILGDPGSGKTTLLLELTDKLLDRAKEDNTAHIPFVFNLSTWAIRRLPFEDWLVEELFLIYGVDKGLGKTLVEDHLILPLLDGLDEVAREHRESCVQAINNFREQHGPMPLIVCSRTEEYNALSVRLNLPTAILVKPLTRPQVEDYLKSFGTSVEGVRAVLRDDETLWELLVAPFMLNIVMLAFKDKPPEYIRGTGTLEERRKQIFDAYKDAMFKRPARSKLKNYNFTPQQTEHWLSWLAKSMKKHNLYRFYLDQIQLDWLPSPQHQKILKMGLVLLIMGRLLEI